MTVSLPTPSATLVAWADVAGGFSALFATLTAVVVITLAVLEARRQKMLGKLERISTAVHSYLDRRPQFYDEALVVNVTVEDEFEDVFENIYRVPKIDNMVGMVEFAVNHLEEIDSAWRKTHPSLVEMIDKDTKYLDGYIGIEAVSTYIADNACRAAISESVLSEVDALRVYEWDEIDSLDPAEMFPPVSYKFPKLNRTAWNKFIKTEEYWVRMKRRLLSSMNYRRVLRQDLRAEVVKIDGIRAKLGLLQLPRNPDDMVEPAHAHG